MNKKRLIITSILSFLLVAILMVGSTYSIFTSSEVDENLNVYTTGNLDVTYTVSDDIFFEDITPMTVSEAEAVFPYRLTVTNVGTVPYQFDVILNDTTSTDSISYQYIMTKVGYLEAKALSDCSSNVIVEDVVVPAGESVDIDIRVWLDESLSNSEIGNSFYAKLLIDGLAVYYDGSNIDNNNLSLKYMNGFTSKTDYSYFKNDNYREKIKNVSFVDYIDTNNKVESWDVSVKGDSSIVAWVVNNEATGYYDLYIGSNYDIYIKDMSWFFCNMIGIENISFENLNTSLTTSMYLTFAGSGMDMSLTTLDLSSFNTSNVTNMRAMFQNCNSLTSLDVSSFDTSSVLDMKGMFLDCNSLTSLDVSNFDTSNVTTMRSMFVGCNSLTSLDVSNFDTSKVTSMYMMFAAASGEEMSLISLDLSSFDTSNVTDMGAMFQNCVKLTNLDVSSFDTSKVTNMKGMFLDCNSLTSLDVSNFNTSKVTNMYGMFSGCNSLVSLNLSGFDTSNVTNMANMFNYCNSLTSLNLSSFDTSKVTDMSLMFNECRSLTSLNLSGFDTSKVTNISYMFDTCSNLSTTITIRNTGTTNYTNMFYRAATATGAKITVNYISTTSSIVDSMIATKSETSNVEKGEEVI